MKDVVHSKNLGIYVVIEYDGHTIKGVDIRLDDPGVKKQGSPVGQAVDAYLKTGKSDFSSYQFDMSGMTPFECQVLEAIYQIPAGKTMTYAEVAKAVGRPKAARAVGNVMAKNPIPLILPCHRVVASNGLGGYTGSLKVKAGLLKLEGAL